jgi:predicted permease
MPKIGEWVRRIWYMVNRRRMERELRDEMDAHRATMGDPAGFGNTLRLREEARDQWGWTWIDVISKDIQFSTRMIRRMPTLALVVMASLAVGIGANTTVFSWLEALILEPIPGVDDSSDYLLIEPVAPSGDYAGGASLPEYRDMREELTSFEGLAAFRMAQVNLTGTLDGERIFAVFVSDNYFSTLGLLPARGRLDPATPGQSEAPGIVVSHAFWQGRSDGASDIVGRAVEINGRTVPIAGVAPPAFQGTVTGLAFDVWIPSTLIPALFPDSREGVERALRGYSVIGRLRDGATRSQAHAEVDRLMTRLEVDFPATNAGYTAEILSFWQAPRGAGQFVLAGLALLQGVMVILLLAVCGNTANLLLGRAMSREREMGIRMASGAGSWQIVRLLMIESVLLGVGGAALGTVVAVGTTGVLSAARFSTLLPVRFEPTVDGLGLLFSGGLGLVSALIFGVVPAVHLAREGALGVRTQSRQGTRATRRILVGVEAALAVAVLIAAGLFLEGFRQTLDSDPGFEPTGILLASYDVSGSDLGQAVAGRGADPTLIQAFTARLLEALVDLPEVEAAAIAAFVPLDIHGLPATRFRVEGHAPTEPNGDLALMNVVTAGYFDAMQIPLSSGRDFRAVDDPSGIREVIVNEEFVRRFVSSDPIGQHIESSGERYQIVGVARDAVYRSFSEPVMPFVHYSFRDQMRGRGQIHLRTRAGNETLLAPEVRRVVRTLDPTLPVFDVRTMVEHVETNLFLRRIPAQMFAILGPLLLLLAAVGVYSVVTTSVAGRTGEIAVRLALGAPPRALARGIVGESMRGVAVGMAAGWVLASVVYDHLSGGPYEPSVFVGIPMTMAAVAAIAAWIPARRATRLDLTRTLRDD